MGDRNEEINYYAQSPPTIQVGSAWKETLTEMPVKMDRQFRWGVLYFDHTSEGGTKIRSTFYGVVRLEFNRLSISFTSLKS